MDKAKEEIVPKLALVLGDKLSMQNSLPHGRAELIVI